MANVTLTFTIPDAKVVTAMAGYLKIYPNGEKSEDGSPKYTDAQWVKEKIRRVIIRDVRRGLQMTANQGAIVAPDDGIVTA